MSVGMDVAEKGVDCGVIERVKCNTWLCFRNVIRMNKDDVVQWMYESMAEGDNTRWRPPVKMIKKSG